jgi:uncharacterized RDD family membrane protein YckC
VHHVTENRNASAEAVSRWQGGTYHPHQTKRMLALEGVEFASFARRFGALAIDFAAMVAVFFAAMLPLSWWSKAYHTDIHIEFKPFENWYSTLLSVFYFGLIVWMTNGRMLGKWLTRIRIVSLSHERISFWHSLERALGYGASLLEAGSGFFQYLFHPTRQTVHDRIAETIVVRLRS